MPMQMAYHKMTLPQVMLPLFFVPIIASVCMPFIGFLCKKYGYRTGWLLGLAILFSASPLGLLVPVYWWSFYMQAYIFAGLGAGYGGLSSAMTAAILNDKVSKYISMRCLVGFGLQIVGAPLYSWLFDAGAETYLARARPVFFSTCMAACNLAILLLPCSPIKQKCFHALDLVEKEKLEAAAAPTGAKTETKKEE
eukprot:CAMPEP_0117613242 /NCGR_PEP_ID=MMETSP0784-20121206/83363_1 /TAXON_ID=39447 /ORGANISM="" /LENGTH=194 /DNA_ID=CAMNT_0005416821 /DNA_START=42 /DNA_END=626 /DNA_ORIENTATION=-